MVKLMNTSNNLLSIVLYLSYWMQYRYGIEILIRRVRIVVGIGSSHWSWYMYWRL